MSPHFGQEKPSGQWIASKYLAHAPSSGKTLWNFGRLVGQGVPMSPVPIQAATLVKYPNKHGSFLGAIAGSKRPGRSPRPAHARNRRSERERFYEHERHLL